MFVNDLIAVVRGHVERIKHGCMGRIEKGGEAFVGAAFDEVKS
ncbi:hypothetical protein MPC1_2240004 [Methylocella tundrae]|nr:hypothetical protein MPC1_2240004 [Methylocella tundrae]